MSELDTQDYANRCRFVTQDPDNQEKLVLSGNNWILVRKRLNVGQQKRIESAGVKRLIGVDGESIEYGVGEYSFARAEVYIIDWSFRNKEDKVVAVNQSSIRALDVDAFDEIEAALTAHIEKMAAEKKLRAGNAARTATS